MAEPLSREEERRLLTAAVARQQERAKEEKAKRQRAEAESEDIALGLGEALDTAKARLKRAEAELREIGWHDTGQPRAEWLADKARAYFEEAGSPPAPPKPIDSHDIPGIG